jgi:hypothetical protein
MTIKVILEMIQGFTILFKKERIEQDANILELHFQSNIRFRKFRKQTLEAAEDRYVKGKQPRDLHQI